MPLNGDVSCAFHVSPPRESLKADTSRLIRILHIIATLDPAGAERQMAQLCRRLDRGRFLPAVCCLTRGGPLEAPLREAGVRVWVLHKGGRWDLGIVPRLREVIREWRPDIVHTWLPTANTLGRLAALLCGVNTLIASERAADAWKGWARRLADRVLGRRSRLILTNAEAVKRFLIERIGLAEARIRVIRNGLDLVEFDALAARGPTAPLPDSGPGPLLGTVGRLEPQKGMTFLVAAMGELKRSGVSARLWIVGDGPDRGDLERQAEAWGVRDSVAFLGRRDDVPALMRRFDVFVLPSLWEGLPNVALEAQAASRPVVATTVDGTPEAVGDGETGLLVPPREPAAMATAIAALLADPGRRESMGAAGRERVARMFGMERMVAETEHAYQEALEEESSHA